MKTRIHLGLFQLYLQQKSVSSSLSLSALKLPEAKKLVMFGGVHVYMCTIW